MNRNGPNSPPRAILIHRFYCSGYPKEGAKEARREIEMYTCSSNFHRLLVHSNMISVLPASAKMLLGGGKFDATLSWETGSATGTPLVDFRWP